MARGPRVPVPALGMRLRAGADVVWPVGHDHERAQSQRAHGPGSGRHVRSQGRAVGRFAVRARVS